MLFRTLTMDLCLLNFMFSVGRLLGTPPPRFHKSRLLNDGLALKELFLHRTSSVSRPCPRCRIKFIVLCRCSGRRPNRCREVIRCRSLWTNRDHPSRAHAVVWSKVAQPPAKPSECRPEADCFLE
jgi:hypothetical protein